MTDADIRNAPPPRIRAAIPADAAAIAAVHVAAWRESYAGLMPDAVLAGLSVARRTGIWDGILSRPEEVGSIATFVAERENGMLGFASCGVQRTPALREQGCTAEIGAIYILRDAQRRGLGVALMAALARALLQRGHQAASLWVLERNAPARRFYERLGGEVIGRKEEKREEMTLTELAYGWRDLGRLLER
ncbi:GNAT family N-acetyltransferase [Roseomonas hellenica]|uniref:GNAT family N-acetyltransferase n=1 Tax=Plastoroseomonas hellenica TaxID=2687306 RepID=A0ABS5F7Y5_9PROT|nr:GNAT family N-acetyltransferase [Plastoroseomonas hellenica]MBR0668677.1 GNAT family N-acetyltransferase [Plastoroseomonas hellenica]